MPHRTTSQWAFDAYQSVRARLPQSAPETTPQHAANLEEIADQFDTFLLDAFGVLNVGQTAIPGVPDRIRALQAAGKRVMVVTNAAGYPKHLLMQRYADLGYKFAPEDVVSSREALLTQLHHHPDHHWGLMASPRFGTDELDHLNADFLAEDAALYDKVAGFLMFGASDWTEERQAILEATLKDNPRPVLVGNPDIVAPVVGGLSKEPGHYAHRLADATGVKPQFFGKPFIGVYDLVFARLPKDIDRSRIVMVGDTLHTDILGGHTAGVKTALITDFGSLKGADVAEAIAQSGLHPDYILPRP